MVRCALRGVEEICATKAPRTMARQLTTKASFHPWDFETLKLIVFRVWVVMALSVPRSGLEFVRRIGGNGPEDVTVTCPPSPGQ